MGIKWVKSESGKSNWPFYRHIFWTGLIVWAVGVRLMKVDPFDDILAMKIDLGTIMDLAVLWAMWMFVWLVAYPSRPRFEASSK